MARSKGSGGKKSSGKGSYRSAISGRYVTAKHGKSNPKTTVKKSSRYGTERRRFESSGARPPVP